MSKIHILLNENFSASQRGDSGGGNTMPAPKKPLIVKENHSANSATVELLEGALRYYPLMFQGLLRGDVLRAHYDCFCKDRAHPVGVRFDKAELQKQERDLEGFLGEPVADWNLIQIKTALILMGFVPIHGRKGLPLNVVSSFQKAPRTFYDAINTPQRALH